MDRDPGLNRPATRSDIDDLFELILGRPLGNDAYAREIEATGVTAALLARALVESNEFGRRLSSGQKPERAQGAVADLDFSKPTTQADTEELFQLILGRQVGDEDYKRDVEASGIAVGDFARTLLDSDEFAENMLTRQLARGAQPEIRDLFYRVPTDLELEPVHPGKVLLIGSCLMNEWLDHIGSYNRLREAETVVERININNASRLPELDDASAAEYGFQIVQIPLRALLPESLYLGHRYTDDQAYRDSFNKACRRMAHNLERSLEYNSKFGMLTFVLNFMTPQQNPTGRLLARYSLRNMVFFIDELNRHLWKLCAARKDVHVVDLEQILSTLGKRFFQDDSTVHLNHSSYLGSIAMKGDGNRLEPVGDVDALYGTKSPEFIAAIYHEIVGAYRSILQHDGIKIVIFDLDDTLWRGVGAEAESVKPDVMAEGWPIGVLEAASYLWRRGILIALVSKNDEENVLRIWQLLYQSRFVIENFVVRKINWRPKAENVGEILQAVNLLPANALFVDDNPVERAAVKQQFPDIRVMDAAVANWRRILLWSPETQRAVITDESVRRTEMVQAQVERDEAARSGSHEEFLASLGVTVSCFTVRTSEDKKYERCFELLNKTNQFNTTGRRWSSAEIQALLGNGGYLIGADVKDRYTAYGVVGVVVVSGSCIDQLAMSCRVFGMDVEIEIVARTLELMRQRAGYAVTAKLVPTDKNKLCLGLYKACGFDDAGDGVWKIESDTPLTVPAHIRAEPLRDGAVSYLPARPGQGQLAQALPPPG